jgi:hypothetical protein
MTPKVDAFHIFGLPHSVWISLEALKELYHQKAASIHPDQFTSIEEKKLSNDKMSQLNLAFNILKETKSRLEHYLELESHTPLPKILPMPPAQADWILKQQSIAKRMDIFSANKQKAETFLEKASFAQEEISLIEQAQDALQVLQIKMKNIETTFEKLQAEHKLLYSEIYNLYVELSYYNKLHQLLQERLFTMASL